MTRTRTKMEPVRETDLMRMGSINVTRVGMEELRNEFTGKSYLG